MALVMEDETVIQQIEIRHAMGPVAERVRRWFETTRRVGKPDGSRSIRLPHPEKRGFDIKIKGAGLLGGQIRFGRFLRAGPLAPLFDFDGRLMADVASGHDNAYLGGASFQQAATEFAVSRTLAGLGHAVVPCLGYGRVSTKIHDSWFSIFEWDRNWRGSLIPPHVPLEEYLAANVRLGGFLVDLATQHGLIGHCWYIRGAEGSYFLKDLHPFRQADPVSMSQLSWVMQLLFALHIRCQGCSTNMRRAKVENLPVDLEAYPLRAVIPDAVAADHERLKTTIVRPYMRSLPADFSPRTLLAALRENRIGAALLERCPPAYARFE
jgi:hypothetical protein